MHDGLRRYFRISHTQYRRGSQLVSLDPEKDCKYFRSVLGSIDKVVNANNKIKIIV